MDEWALAISPYPLFARWDACLAPALIDVCLPNGFCAENVPVSGTLHLPHDAQDLRPRSSVVVRYRRRREVGQRAASASRGTGMQPAHPGRRNSAVIYDNLYSWGRLQAEKPELRANAMTKRAA